MSRIVLSGLALALAIQSVAAGHSDDWTRFRGANGSGVAAASHPPLSWNATTNVAWKVDLPGPGSSCPIILGDRVYLTCYTGYGVSRDDKSSSPADLKRHLIALSLADGSEIWRATIDSAADEDPWQGFIQEHGFASPTPVTDGQRIYVQCGKTGLVAFDMNGKHLWTRSLGTFSDPMRWGDGASPVVWKDLVIANAGINGHAIVAVRSDSGEVAWEYKADDLTNSWSTPLIATVNGTDELVCACPGRIFALDPSTGAERWAATSPIVQTVCPSPVLDNGVVYLMGGRAGDAIAVRCGGYGNVDDSHIVWKSKLRAGIGTPVVVGGHLYWTTGGIAFCANCETGQEVYRERVRWSQESGDQEDAAPRRGPTGDYASAIAVGDQVLVLTRAGKAQWIRASGSYEPLGEGSFGDDPGPFNATPAVAGDRLLIRSDRSLYCVGNKPAGQ